MEAIRWDGSTLHLLDQRVLPTQKNWIRCDDWTQVVQAIENMVVRGAPAIAITAAYGMALAVQQNADRQVVERSLLASRPTAVNLRWALERLADVPNNQIEDEAIRIHNEDRAICLAIGEHGAHFLEGGVVTICNTGALATGGQGTALGMVRTALAKHQSLHLYVLETRPYLQGARLTATECIEDGIPFTLVADSMAGALMAKGDINAVVVGCDRVARNGDTANKIGTYNLAVLAHHHAIPFYVAMPLSTLDTTTLTGMDIPIEERSPEELCRVGATTIAPDKVNVWNPAFDITPANLITAWVTEKGLWEPPSQAPLDGIHRNR